MDTVEALARKLRPEHTILLLGAGATVPSGAPTGAELAKFLAGKLYPRPEVDSLSEVATIFEHRASRRELVEALRERLSSLRPTGGLLLLPEYDWVSIYSTNFDQLIERAYREATRQLKVIRSNYDWTKEQTTATPLYKIHGCITQDVGVGNKHRMVITERDYDQVEEYHQTVFTSLEHQMYICDTLIIGQSLADRHLKELAKKACKLNDKAGTPGRVYLLAYNATKDSALIYEQWGIDITVGSLDSLLHAFAAVRPPATDRASGSDGESGVPLLPVPIRAATIDCAHATGLRADARRLYNGGAAQYPDIAAGYTIERAVEQRLLDSQVDARMLCTVIVGAAGVGKTSTARRLLAARMKQDFACWEHRNAFPLDIAAWLEVEHSLRTQNRQGFLFVDDCTDILIDVNRLIDGLAVLDRSHLRLVLTGNAGQWQSRRKSPALFKRGHTEKMSRLTTIDIERLVNLVEQQPDIHDLVDETFLTLNHTNRIRHLRDRCSADMYVCLKNIFGAEELDDILLGEFKDLDDAPQDVYRHVCAIQAMGGKVHRQLIVRLLGIDGGLIKSMLGQLDGIVFEEDIDARRGTFGWSARHDVIADVIATYKFGDPEEQKALLRNLIDGLNPSVSLELATANAMAASEMGIGRLPSRDDQIDLLTRLIAVVPAARTPQRRLVRKYLDAEDASGAKLAIDAATRNLGQDDIIDRYKVRVIVLRSGNTENLMLEDRVSLLHEARSQAAKLLLRRPDDRHNYRLLCDVGVELMRINGDSAVLEDGIDKFRAVEDDIPDPDFIEDRKRYEQMLRVARQRP
ncbi:SIR2 family protein [Mumia zhuanghuii]|uniref:SIR2 family protein n=1 Tax=Mumia zhuanghuii TaxID=2585211 RepID=UPI003641EDD9